MSHLSKIKTQVRDLGCLREALDELGLDLEIGENLEVRDYFGATAAVQAKASFGKYGFGFVKQPDGTYQMVGDLWALARAGLKSFEGLAGQECVGRVNQSYAKATAVRAARLQGYSLASQQRQQDGTLRLVLRRY